MPAGSARDLHRYRTDDNDTEHNGDNQAANRSAWRKKARRLARGGRSKARRSASLRETIVTRLRWTTTRVEGKRRSG
ncbi:hypothetical protein X777_12876 [Ooceraea biroi]|uniref:Uncharacterized protein n=1 Tax=Ooceraea biroi TaxID=2015173 RepID=A0A026VY45_OOCBI|nr:hypothetical protein X777_12876 [Ooceraea biroi]